MRTFGLQGMLTRNVGVLMVFVALLAVAAVSVTRVGEVHAAEPKVLPKAPPKKSKAPAPRTKTKRPPKGRDDRDPQEAAGRPCSDKNPCPSGLLCLSEPGGGRKCRVADDTALLEGLSL